MKALVFMSVPNLAAALRAAEVAHAEYEKTLGHRDDNWADWYADYIYSITKQGDGFFNAVL